MIIAGLALLGLYFSVTKHLPFLASTSGQVVTAQFAEPNQVTGKTAVRVDGIDVGNVQSVTLEPGARTSVVKLLITDSAVHLHLDARAAIKFRTLLGANMEIDLDPGSPSAPPLAGATIPLSRTTVQTEFDDLLSIFRGNAPAAMRTDLAQLSSALQGQAAGRLIDRLAPSLQSVPAGLSAIQGELPNDLQNLIGASASTVRSIGADRATLEELVGGAQQTFATAAGQAAQLGQTLDRAPAAMDATVAVSGAIDRTLPELNSLSDALVPGAKALAPAALAARPAVIELDQVLHTAQPLIAALRPAVTDLAAAAAPGSSVVNGLKPTVARLNNSIIPWLERPDSDLHIPFYDLIGPTLGALASAAAEYDGHGHYLHFPAGAGLDSLGTIPCTVFVADPTASELVRCEALNQVLGDLLQGKL
jgi:virulence factor Mce-like protein